MKEFNIKSQLVQKRNHHVGIKKKKCRNINLGHSEHGENDDYKNRGEKKRRIILSDHYLVVIISNINLRQLKHTFSK